ncbi:uncharacterized protein LOC106461354 isoform X2 [Limulus polyphemus]|uniref:Cysteine protease n=1 Tax=Limulus polyphemus TaxID=6850 RepID=A0ABM1SK13_LIMPO|nr:uncharacterized protein LOC106461354 isoform X2 [Limulus polyphemus]
MSQHVHVTCPKETHSFKSVCPREAGRREQSEKKPTSLSEVHKLSNKNKYKIKLDVPVQGVQPTAEHAACSNEVRQFKPIKLGLKEHNEKKTISQSEEHEDIKPWVGKSYWYGEDKGLQYSSGFSRETGSKEQVSKQSTSQSSVGASDKIKFNARAHKQNENNVEHALNLKEIKQFRMTWLDDTLARQQVKKKHISENEMDGNESSEKVKTKLKSLWNNMKYGWTVKIKTNFSYETPIWLLGQIYHKKLLESATASMERFKQDFISRIWLTYRKEFPVLAGSTLTTDCGWGCMLRSGQMMLAQALLCHFLGWRWHGSQTERTEIFHRMIIRWFGDDMHPRCPFSVHHLVAAGQSLGKKAGDWYGPASVAYILKQALELSASDHPLLDEICIYVAQDCTVYIDDVIEMCTSSRRHSTECKSSFLNSVSHSCESARGYWNLLSESHDALTNPAESHLMSVPENQESVRLYWNPLSMLHSSSAQDVENVSFLSENPQLTQIKRFNFPTSHDVNYSIQSERHSPSYLSENLKSLQVSHLGSPSGECAHHTENSVISIQTQQTGLQEAAINKFNQAGNDSEGSKFQELQMDGAYSTNIVNSMGLDRTNFFETHLKPNMENKSKLSFHESKNEVKYENFMDNKRTLPVQENLLHPSYVKRLNSDPSTSGGDSLIEHHDHVSPTSLPFGSSEDMIVSTQEQTGRWRGVVVLIPTRLGGADLNLMYIPCIKSLLSHENCIGIIGGRPKHSLYFVGWQEDKLIYLDPHYCQETVDVLAPDFSVQSFHCSFPRKMSFARMDPSCTIGFYFRERDEFLNFSESIKGVLVQSHQQAEYPVFVVANGHSSTTLDASDTYSWRLLEEEMKLENCSQSADFLDNNEEEGLESHDFVLL